MFNINSSFIFLQVPELFQLYNASHVNDHQASRSFLLSNLSAGIREVLDYCIAKRSFTATLVLGMLQSPTANIELRVGVVFVINYLPTFVTHQSSKFTLFEVFDENLFGKKKIFKGGSSLQHTFR